jgi:hypothetical protein
MRAHPEFSFSAHYHAWRQDEWSDAASTPLRFEEITRTRLFFTNPMAPSATMVTRAIEFRFPSGQRYMEDHMLWATMVHSGLRAAKLKAWLSRRFSRPYGAAGLSRNLWRMEQAELRNYWALKHRGAMPTAWLILAVPWSLAKFARRILITALQRVLVRLPYRVTDTK